MEDEFTKMSDETLAALVAVPPNNAAHRAAAAEMHRRQKRKEDKNTKIQKWILCLTIPILILTLIGVIFAVLSYFKQNIDMQTNGNNPHYEKQNNQTGIDKIIVHEKKK